MSEPSNSVPTATEKPHIVVRDEVITVRTVVSVSHVDESAVGTFGWFLNVRSKHNDTDKDRRRFGVCIICSRHFTDEEQVHFVFGVVRNNKTVGNRLCCAACAEVHVATFNSKEGGQSRSRWIMWTWSPSAA